MRVAFATHSGRPEITPDDGHAAEELRARGIEVVGVPWDQESVDWAGFDAVVIRSTWNYYLKGREFFAWLDALERAKVRVWNPVSVLRWNAHKGYLPKLAGQGVRTVPTEMILTDDRRALADVLAARGWTKAVVKPALAAGAYETFVTTAATASADQRKLEKVLERSDVLVQPYLEEIATDGEWSVIFFDGKFSHAAHKLPKAGDFRVQAKHGGALVGQRPSDHVIEGAARVLEVVKERLLYARVDGVVLGGEFVLMELEVLEPELFLRLDEGAAGRFAGAIEALLSG